MLASAFGYAASTLIYRRWLAEVPALGATVLMLALRAVFFVVPGAVGVAGAPAPDTAAVVSLVVLGALNTGVAYWLYYKLIETAGTSPAAVTTYVTPAVALLLGVALLGEKLTVVTVIGLVLNMAGAWAATQGSRARERTGAPG